MSVLSIKNLQISQNKTSSDGIILNDVSLDLYQGEFVCLCGPNGSGKSTLLSAIADVIPEGLKKTDGKILYDEADFLAYSRMEKAKILAYMQQTEQSVWDFSVFDFVLQGRYAHSNGGYYSEQDFQIVDEVIEELGFQDFAARTVHSLSGGEFQKARIARVFAQQPQFLLLDEPAASLDFVFEPQLMRFLKEAAKIKNIGILVTVHDINLAYNYADRIMLLPPKMKIIEGTPDSTVTPENLKITFGVDFQCKETKSFQLSL